MKNLIASLLFSVIVVSNVFAQQQVTYTQYMFNPMSINPAYIGTQGGLNVLALSRWQWQGIEGAPRTQTLAVNSSIPGKNIGIGFQATRDEIAVSKTTSFMFGYSYRIGIGNGFLNMGLQGGVQNFSTDFNSVYTLNDDPSFNGVASGFKPNFGAGLFYYNPIFYTGVSAPLLINSSVSYDGQNIYTQERHYFLTSGTVFTISPDVKIKPNFLLKMVNGAPLSADYNLNVLLKEILWLGVSYRPPESISFLMELNINQKIRVGYSYDYVIDQVISQQANSSHELLLSYKIDWVHSNVTTPRYF